MASPITWKEKLGCWGHERWRTELAIRAPRLAARFGLTWQDLCNRHERLKVDPISGGRICCWADSSKLTVARVFPRVAPTLLRQALAEWPIEFNFSDLAPVAAQPEVSILIAIGGIERLPQFELALAAARAQRDVSVELIVVEQSATPQLFGWLPKDVRYVHQSAADGQQGFNKSWALNRAAREARGATFVILDADYLVPRDFAKECHRILKSIEGVRPGRLLFYLTEHATRRLKLAPRVTTRCELDCVVANNPTPVAVRSNTYWSIGGHDESYFGWGGEDIEFLERLRTRQVSEGGWVPIVHAWHPPAPKKHNGDRNTELHSRITALAVDERIRRLMTIPSGGVTPQMR
jgi:hypothetical protein